MKIEEKTYSSSNNVRTQGVRTQDFLKTCGIFALFWHNIHKTQEIQC